MEEIWKELAIPEFGTIKVSSIGRVHLHPSRYHPEGKIIEGSPDTHGYRIITVFLKGRRKCLKVHRLIAMAFLPNPNNLPQVNHLDGIKTHNLFSNLEWCTASENQLHAIRLGLRPRSVWHEGNIEKAARGSYHGNSVLTEEKVLEMRSLFKLGISLSELAKKYAIRRQTSWLICNRKRWMHI